MKYNFKVSEVRKQTLSFEFSFKLYSLVTILLKIL